MQTRCKMARMASLDPVALIARKRDALPLTREEISALVEGLGTGKVADYQMSAWLMAAWLNGLSEDETVALTEAMLHSGRVLQLPTVSLPKVDKHSTGGVGDKISLCLAPLVAACGVAVPMISGRGLGHTGGTLDKLEAITGYQTRLDVRRFEKIVRQVGCSMIGQTAELAPADGRIYALRDVTATVESIPLIVASILSKKLAAGLDGLVLDVKVGRGAFMKTPAQARALAQALVRVGTRAGCRVGALLTAMDVPIGNTIGNALETREAIEVLADAGPADTRELTLALAERMQLVAGVTHSRAQARKRAQLALSDGSAMECFLKMVKAHGGDVRQVQTPRLLPATRCQVPVLANRSGWVTDCDAFALGWLAVRMGAGRLRAEDKVDHAVGIELTARPGDKVVKGQSLCLLHVRSPKAAQALLAPVGAAFVIGRSRPATTPLVLTSLGAKSSRE
jgi:pyrimidine-nucleoside phosphorylase